MKKLSFILCCIISIVTFSQENKDGIQFQHYKFWAEALSQAKAENKYVFVDCYTTWCGLKV